MKTLNIFCLYILLIYNIKAQQDPMFTRYMFISDMMYNPASTASNGQMRVMAFYRNQWAGLKGAPITTGLNFELPISSTKAGLGFNIYNDQIGFESHTGTYINYAYKIGISDEWQLALGIKGGMSIFRANLQQALTPDPIGNDPEYRENTQSIVPKVGAGLFLSNGKTYAGFSIPALAAMLPKDGFAFVDEDAYLSKHFYLTVGHVINLQGSDLQIKPLAFVKYHQAAPLQVDLGLQCWYKDFVSLGISYRTGDAIAGMVDLGLTKEIILSYAYDYTHSDFRSIGQGAHEIIVQYIWNKKNVSIPSIHKFSTLPRY